MYSAWWESSTPNDFQLFEGIIINSEELSSITIQVDVMLPNVVKAETTFDFEMGLLIQDAGLVNLRSVL